MPDAIAPRRWRLRLLLFLGSVALCALVAAKLSWRRVDRAPAARAPERSPGESVASAPDPVAPDSAEKAAGEGEAPDWQLVAKDRGAGRAYTASELTAALVAEFTRNPVDPRGLHHANIGALQKLLRERSETEILTAAAALLDCGSREAAAVAWRLVAGVLGNSRRAVTDDEAYTIVGEPAARAFEAHAGDLEPRMHAGKILATIGTPRATDVLLRALERHEPAAEQLGHVSNPASVPLLSQALTSRRNVDAYPVAAALCRSADGRAELRRLLDPAGGFGWKEHVEGKIAALTALAAGFREPEDLSAIETTLKQKPDLTDAAQRALARGNDVPTSKSPDSFTLTRMREQAAAIVSFLPGRAGARIEDALFTTLGQFPARIVDPLLPRLEAARPGARERVEAKRKPTRDAAAR